jgi:hypothetical protein
MSKYEIHASFKGGDRIVAEFRRMRDEATKTSKAMHEMGRPLERRWRESSESYRRSQDKIRESADRAGGAFSRLERGFHAYDRVSYSLRDAKESLRAYADEAIRLARAQEKFKSINLSATENEKAFRAVKQTVDSIKGITLADTTETVIDLYTALGDLDHAIEALPIASKFRFSFQTLFGDKFNAEQLEEQIQAAFKYLEVTGAVAKGQSEMEARFNAMAQIQAATGGRVTPSDLLQVARRAGPAAQGLSLQGMQNLATLVPEVGAEGTGTALMSMYQALVGGVMKQSAAAEFVRLGLVDPKKIEFGHGQKIKRLLPGANKLGQLMQEDPLKAADALMEAMKKPLRGPAIDTSNADKVREELAILFGNRTAQKLMSILTTQRGQVVKEAGIAQAAKNIEQLYGAALDSPMGKMQQFEAAMANFRAEVGTPLLSAVTQAVSTFKPFLSLMGEYPRVTLMALAVGKLARVAADLNALGSLDLFGRGARAAIADQARGVEKASEKVALYKRQLTGIPAMIGTTVVLSLATEVIRYILQLREEAKQAWEDAKGAASENKRATLRLYAEKKVPGEQIMQIGFAQMPASLASFIKGYEARNAPTFSGFGSLFSSTGRKATLNDPQKLVEDLRKYMPELSIPSQFVMFARALEENKTLSKQEKSTVYESAEKAFPDAAAEYRKAMRENANDYAAAIKQMLETDRAAARSMGDLSTSAQKAADELKKIKAPGGVDQDGKPIPIPKMDTGGDILRDGPAYLHRGERVIPAQVVRQYQSRVQASSSRTAHVSLSVSVDARGSTADPAAIRAAVLSAGDELKQAIIRMLDEEYSDRGLSI